MVVDTIWEFKLTRYKFGLGAAREIGYDIRSLGGSRVLLVTDKGVAKARLPNQVISHLKEQSLDVEVWDGVEPEPSAKSIEAGIEWAEFPTEEEFWTM